MWLEPPATAAQRDRWLAIIDLVDKYHLASSKEILDLLKKEHGITISLPVLHQDLAILNIDKFQGIYLRVPFTETEEVRQILRYRMRAVAESLFAEGNVIVINTNGGSAEWVATPLRELNDPDIVSVNSDAGGRNVWILTRGGRTQRLVKELRMLWRGV